jgi:hypothetical protein
MLISRIRPAASASAREPARSTQAASRRSGRRASALPLADRKGAWGYAVHYATLAAALIALSALAASPTAAACSDRPGTPNNVKLEPVAGREADTLRLTWNNTASERVWWDIEISDKGGKVVQSVTGGEPVKAGRGATSRDFSSYGVNTTRCFRIRARTAGGTQGCVSQIWSARVCATTASSQPAPNAGRWSALAADGKGSWGFAANQPNERQAKRLAVQSCGAPLRCRIAVAGPVGCYAYFESKAGGYWYGLALHSSRNTAEQVARLGCSKGAPAGTCKLVKSNCERRAD